MQRKSSCWGYNMATINPKKFDSIKSMLLQFFSNNDPVSKEFLDKRVEEDIIAIAKEEGFIIFANGKYKITAKGKNYRDE